MARGVHYLSSLFFFIWSGVYIRILCFGEFESYVHPKMRLFSFLFLVFLLILAVLSLLDGLRGEKKAFGPPLHFILALALSVPIAGGSAITDSRKN